MNGHSISKATLGRLPQYLQYLRRLPQCDGETISATAIARGLSLGEVQVRKDLAAVSGAGKPRIGYITSDLIRILESHLGHEKITSAVLVGAGKLGCALLDYDGFEEYGVKIVAAFDCNEKLVNTEKFNTEIMPMTSLNSYCEEHDVKLGIITVGENSAQQVCNQMVSSGITAIWNFAPCGLKVPDGILLKQENLALSLAYLNNQLYK
ncbi:MAG: redox-sensing transcriptional repressor Rex [Ruminococcaceae bacterium]|nr:redox-sensing transcriptional repressor Rex [Oscillospiraceae bacterium]